jgi:hypothetical protein
MWGYTMIALYKGKSLISKGIRLFTWSDYSHVSWVTNDLRLEYESWQSSCPQLGKKSGIQADLPFGINHTKGTQVDIFKVRGITPEQEQGIVQWYRAHEGRPYDYMGILGFPLRVNFQHDNSYFCSEAQASADKSVGLSIVRGETYKMKPDTYGTSGMLIFDRTIIL